MGSAGLKCDVCGRRAGTRSVVSTETELQVVQAVRIGGVLACQRPDHPDQLTWLIRLAKKKATHRHVLVANPHQARRKHKLNWWPTVTDGVRKSQSVHASRHIDVGKDDPDVLLTLEDCNGLVCSAGFEHTKACFLQKG
jgi:hypothetical protein